MITDSLLFPLGKETLKWTLCMTPSVSVLKWFDCTDKNVVESAKFTTSAWFKSIHFDKISDYFLFLLLFVLKHFAGCSFVILGELLKLYPGLSCSRSCGWKRLEKLCIHTRQHFPCILIDFIVIPFFTTLLRKTVFSGPTQRPHSVEDLSVSSAP